jgi:DNA-binding HxlR family transcriptional regulator
VAHEVRERHEAAHQEGRASGEEAERQERTTERARSGPAIQTMKPGHARGNAAERAELLRPVARQENADQDAGRAQDLGARRESIANIFGLLDLRTVHCNFTLGYLLPYGKYIRSRAVVCQVAFLEKGRSVEWRRKRKELSVGGVDPGCRAFQLAIDVLARPWSGLILGLLGQGKLRFSELEARAHGVGAKTLSARLKELERRGLVARCVESGLRFGSATRSPRKATPSSAWPRRSSAGGRSSSRRARERPRSEGGACSPGERLRRARSPGRSSRSRTAAVSGASEPWIAFASIDAAKSLRIVPAAALPGSVAPMISRSRAIAPSRSSTIVMQAPRT